MDIMDPNEVLDRNNSRNNKIVNKIENSKSHSSFNLYSLMKTTMNMKQKLSKFFMINI